MGWKGIWVGRAGLEDPLPLKALWLSAEDPLPGERAFC